MINTDLLVINEYDIKAALITNDGNDLTVITNTEQELKIHCRSTTVLQEVWKIVKEKMEARLPVVGEIKEQIPDPSSMIDDPGSTC